MTLYYITGREHTTEQESEFEKIFGTTLKQWTHYITGFDVIGFDEFINPDPGVSCAQAVKAKYGQRAQDLIMEVIHA